MYGRVYVTRPEPQTFLKTLSYWPARGRAHGSTQSHVVIPEFIPLVTGTQSLFLTLLTQLSGKPVLIVATLHGIHSSVEGGVLREEPSTEMGSQDPSALSAPGSS